MKEATGELNMTVITVVAIAAVAALFTFFLLPRIRANITLSTACSQVNSRGNYNDQAGDAVQEGEVHCDDFICQVEYQGNNYERDCKADN